MDVTVTGTPARQIGYDTFVDITPANVTNILTTGDGMSISFDADVSAVANKITARVLASDNAHEQSMLALWTFVGELSSYIAQAQADASGWPTADQAARDLIMGRVLNGFGQLCTALQALASHLNLTAGT